MVDPTRAKLARLLNVSDADVYSFEYSHPMAGYVVEMRTGGDVLVTDRSFYSLDDHPNNKTMARYEDALAFAKATSGDPYYSPDVGSQEVSDTSQPIDDSHAEEIVEEGHDASPFVPTGTSNDVMVWVDGDADRAKDALAKERERDKPRVALIKQLERIMDGG